MYMQNFSKIVLLVQELWVIFTIWTSAKHRLMENGTSWARAWQWLRVCDFIKIFHTVLEIGPVSYVQNLDLCKASTTHGIWKSLRLAGSCQYQCVCKFSIQTFFMVQGLRTVFTIWTSAEPRPIDNDILQSHGLDFVNINGHAKFHQTIA